MAATEFGVGSELAVKRWRVNFATEPEKKMYFTRFMGTGENAIIVILQDLQKQAGQDIVVDLFMKPTGDGVEGDDIIEGTTAEESLSTFADTLRINQRRKSFKSKGKASEQRVLYNMRDKMKSAGATWFGEDYDAQCMLNLAGARGIDTTVHVPLNWTGRAGNSLTAPDAAHIVYGGSAAAKTDLDSADIMDVSIADKIVAKIDTMDPAPLLVNIDGEQKAVCVMHPFQAYDFRKSVSNNDWMDVQKRMGKDSLIFKNALGEWNGVIFHKHRNVVRFSDYGAGANVTAARALVLCAQAGIIAWGGAVSGVSRYSWNEETDDRGNALVVTPGAIYGMKGTIFDSKWYGRFAIDTYYDDPT